MIAEATTNAKHRACDFIFDVTMSTVHTYWSFRSATIIKCDSLFRHMYSDRTKPSLWSYSKRTTPSAWFHLDVAKSMVTHIDLLKVLLWQKRDSSSRHVYSDRVKSSLWSYNKCTASNTWFHFGVATSTVTHWSSKSVAMTKHDSSSRHMYSDRAKLSLCKLQQMHNAAEHLISFWRSNFHINIYRYSGSVTITKRDGSSRHCITIEQRRHCVYPERQRKGTN
jgi:hypothetical protein